MTITKNTVLAAMAAVSVFSTSLQAQLKVPAPSPSQTLKQSIGLGEITIDYSRPSVKGRVVFGDLVPYGKVWRTGANATTKITFSDDVKLEGNDVKAGTYGLYTIPNKDSWEVMLYKDLSLNGNVADYKAENEALHIKVKPSMLANKVESFTINLADLTSNAATLELMWDKTRVPVMISTDIDSRIMKNIEANVTADNRPYFQAASYYYDNNKDLKQALEWANRAAEQNQKAFWVVMLRAKIESKLNDKAATLSDAEKVITLAKEAKNDDYVKQAEKLIAETKSGK